MQTNDQAASGAKAAQLQTDLNDTTSPAEETAGADPADVRTNIGATSGVIPSSYGAAGDLEDAH